MATTPEGRRLARIDAAPAPATVTAFACGVCPKVYTDPAEARACCTCSTCGAKFPHDDIERGYFCGFCWYPTARRNAREQVKACEASLQRAQRQLDEAREEVARLASRSRPARGTAQTEWMR